MEERSNPRIIQVLAICRHGARTHLRDVSDYFESTMIDKKGLKKGELTPTGFIQLFQLGKKIKSEYPNMFQQGYNKEKHFFKSSNISRTIKSSIGLFYGLFDIHQLPKIDQSLSHENSLPPWPGTTAFDEKEIDFTLDMNKLSVKPKWLEVTPDIKNEYELRAHVTPEYKKLLAHYKGDIKDFVDEVYQSSPFQKYMKHAEDYSLKSLELKPIEMLKDSDFFVSELKNNPECEYEENFIESVQLVNHGKHFQRYINPIGNKALCSPLMCYVLKAMNEKIAIQYSEANSKFEQELEGKNEETTIAAKEDSNEKSLKEIFKQEKEFKPKNGQSKGYDFVSLLTHDTVITPMLLNFNVKDLESVINTIKEGQIFKGYLPKPPFASSIIFELLKDEENKYFVRVRYNGEYLDFCKKKRKEDEYHTVPFEEFRQYVLEHIFEDWKHFLDNFDKKTEYGLLLDDQ